MRVRQYTPDDRSTVEEWVKTYDQNWSLEHMPALGWVVEDEFGLVAAGWLLQTDGGFTMLEGFATNRHAPAASRHEALTMLNNTAEMAARELGYSRLIAYLQHDGLLKRAIDSGYKDVCRCAMVVKDL